MNNIIRKYKDVDMQIQSSRKQVKIKWIMSCIAIMIIIWIIWIIILTTFSTGKVKSLYAILALMILHVCFDLYRTDWSLKTKDNVLFLRKWIFKYEIPYRDLIDIKEDWWCHDSYKREFLEIKYKKGNRVKYFQIDTLWRYPFFKYEFIEKSKITELVNIFFRCGELIDDKKENNILLPDYKNIRTKEEEKEIDDFLNRRKKIEKSYV